MFLGDLLSDMEGNRAQVTVRRREWCWLREGLGTTPYQPLAAAPRLSGGMHLCSCGGSKLADCATQCKFGTSKAVASSVVGEGARSA